MCICACTSTLLLIHYFDISQPDRIKYCILYFWHWYHGPPHTVGSRGGHKITENRRPNRTISFLGSRFLLRFYFSRRSVFGFSIGSSSLTTEESVQTDQSLWSHSPTWKPQCPGLWPMEKSINSIHFSLKPVRPIANPAHPTTTVAQYVATLLAGLQPAAWQNRYVPFFRLTR